MIQMWQNGVMMGLISKVEADQLVYEGSYRWINTQAVEWLGRMGNHV